MIRRIEELSINAFPSEQTIQYDGWILRFAPGNTSKRVNSINPLYDSSLPLEEKIKTCEAFYQDRGLPVVFKLTEAEMGFSLDKILDQKHYEEKARTLILTKDLRGTGNASTPDDQASLFQALTIENSFSLKWLDTFCRISSKSASAKASLEKVLVNVAPKCVYVSIGDLACGMGVIDSGYIGIYNIAVAPEYRKQGFGKKIMDALLQIGLNEGVTATYLQVEQANEPAVNLYTKLGYTHSHDYWYRIKPLSQRPE